MQIISKIKKVEDGNSYNQTKSSAIVDNVDDSVEPISVVEPSNFFNLNLSHSYVDNVEEFIENYAISTDSLVNDGKCYKMVLTKKPTTGYTTIAHGLFENLEYSERITTAYTTNILSVDILFLNSNGEKIRCTCSYLNGRYSDNGSRDYAPSNFFATVNKQSWCMNATASHFSEIANVKGQDLVFEILFKTKISLNELNNLTFDNGRGNVATEAPIVNVKVYESDDLETFTEIIDKDVPYEDKKYTFTID